MVAYLLPAAGLFAEVGFGQVWQRLIAGLDAQARRLISPALLRARVDLLCGPAAGV
ncbi:hypothetical protein Rhow_001220 [Rhodococcus wratislaviensis]|uniref:Uncharacterized protein n=1 Tax=Rhodococcus wratislaviensis TaxID=44752 RepID=A0A402C3L4_RHOWR|nr:hypothetical protein Rhow_001220 [Rhodococcus wratislaviensis]